MILDTSSGSLCSAMYDTGTWPIVKIPYFTAGGSNLSGPVGQMCGARTGR